VIAQQDLPLARAGDHAARVGPTGVLAAGTAAPASVGVGTGRAWRFAQGLPHMPLRASPAPGAFAGAGLLPEAYLDLMGDQGLEHGVARPHLRELPAGHAHHVWHLLVGIQDHRSSGFAHRHGAGEVATACLVQQSLAPALPQEGQFRRRQRALPAPPQAVADQRWIVDPIHITKRRATARTPVPPLLPIGAGACQARHLPAQAEAPWPRPTCETSRGKPARPTLLVPDVPRSSSITSTRSAGQPSPSARCANAYGQRVDAWCASTCWPVDWRSYTTARRVRCLA
jgi:hypothetical protein